MYEVREVGERGIRVRSHTGDIRYEFANDRFAPSVAVPVVDPAIAARQLNWVGKTGCLTIGDVQYAVQLEWNEYQWCLSSITRLYV